MSCRSANKVSFYFQDLFRSYVNWKFIWSFSKYEEDVYQVEMFPVHAMTIELKTSLQIKRD